MADKWKLRPRLVLDAALSARIFSIGALREKITAKQIDNRNAKYYICTMVQICNSKLNPELMDRLNELLSPRFFKALGDPSRIGLLVSLAAGSAAQTVSEIAKGSQTDMSVVSRHLAILRDAGVVESQKRGKEVWYSIRANAVVQMLRDLADCVEACCVPQQATNNGGNDATS